MLASARFLPGPCTVSSALVGAQQGEPPSGPGCGQLMGRFHQGSGVWWGPPCAWHSSHLIEAAQPSESSILIALWASGLALPCALRGKCLSSAPHNACPPRFRSASLRLPLWFSGLCCPRRVDGGQQFLAISLTLTP